MKNILFNNNYKIHIYDNKINIFNYKSIRDISSNVINIRLEDFDLKLKGENLLVIKLDDKDISISGVFKEIVFCYE